MDFLIRQELLLGKEQNEKLKNAKIIVFGIGGVGGFSVEALARAGVCNIALVDSDRVEISNINRQIVADHSTIGKLKTEVMKERILKINPNACVKTFNTFYLKETADEINLEDYDYIIDAIDTVSAKLELISRAKEKNIKIISCMGTGGKLDITALKVVDVYQTKNCPLSRVMRRELKKRNISSLKVVYSSQNSAKASGEENIKNSTRPSVPSMIFVPATAGLLLASEVVKEILGV